MRNVGLISATDAAVNEAPWMTAMSGCNLTHLREAPEKKCSALIDYPTATSIWCCIEARESCNTRSTELSHIDARKEAELVRLKDRFTDHKIPTSPLAYLTHLKSGESSLASAPTLYPPME